MSKLSHSHQPTMDQIDAERIRENGFDMDAEANQFAMELLMPEELLRTEIEKMGGFGDIESGDGYKRLAKKFRVSESIMTLRLGQLFMPGVSS